MNLVSIFGIQVEIHPRRWAGWMLAAGLVLCVVALVTMLHIPEPGFHPTPGQ